MEFVVAAFAAGENLIVAGDHNAGKTTFLRAVCLAAIPPHQRVVTVEAFITELGLHRGERLPNTVALYSRPPSAEGEGEVTVADLIRRASRRLNPTRVIVGEVFGEEVGPVLDVFSGSTRGSGCTIHARSARGAVRRFEQYGLASHPPVPVEAINYGLAEASPIIVHLAGDESTEGRMRRYCTSIVEVTGLDEGRVATTELWGLDAERRLVPRHALSSPRRERMARAGWDWMVVGLGAVAERGRRVSELVVALVAGAAAVGGLLMVSAWTSPPPERVGSPRDWTRLTRPAGRRRRGRLGGVGVDRLGGRRRRRSVRRFRRGAGVAAPPPWRGEGGAGPDRGVGGVVRAAA